jgi:hypothetical protein
VSLTRKSVQEINFPSHQDGKSKFAAHTKGMPIVKCVCGAEILVLPDLKAMKNAIKNHVAEHKQASSPKWISKLGSLEEFLTEQILIEATKMNLSK